MPEWTTALRLVLEADGRVIPALRRIGRSVADDVYLVGGCVRDALLGRVVTDIDLALDEPALEYARSFAQAVRGTFVALDETEDIGRVVVRRKITFDFASLKGRTLEQDLARRDFTINAMACRLEDVFEAEEASRIIDPFGGVEDLRRRRLAVVSERAFTDDPLRLLRAYRFAAQLGLTVEPRTARWIERDVPGIRATAVERILYELAILLTQPAMPWIGRMKAQGLLDAILPECADTGMEPTGSFRTLSLIEGWLAAPETLRPGVLQKRVKKMIRQPIAGSRAWVWMVRLAAILFGDGPSRMPREDLINRIAMNRLRLSIREHQALQRITRLPFNVLRLSDLPEDLDMRLYRIVKKAGEDTAGVALMTLALCRIRGYEAARCEPILERLLALEIRRRRIETQPRLINGHDLMQTFDLPPGRRIGRMLSRLEEAQTLDLIRTKSDALDMVRVWLREQSV